jgi:hypothetical protein
MAFLNFAKLNLLKPTDRAKTSTNISIGSALGGSSITPTKRKSFISALKNKKVVKK